MHIFKNTKWTSLLSLFCCATTTEVLHAADKFKTPADSNGKFFMGGSVGLNISANFSGFGGFPRQTSPGPNAGPGNRFYDDGFNLIENAGVPDTLTFRWDYSNASQVDLANNRIKFHSYTTTPTLSEKNVDDGVHPGVELGYMRRFGMIGEKISWGLMGSFNYLKVDIRSRTSLVGNANVITDTFDTAGNITSDANGNAAPAPGLNVFNSGTRIQNVPLSRTFTTLPGGLVASGVREIDADIFSLKLGPYLEFPLSEKFSLSLSGGFVLGGISSKFSYQEANNIAAIGTPISGVSTSQSFTGSDSASKFLPGGFVSLQGNYAFNDRWNIFAGGQFQYLDSLSQSVNGRSVKLNLGQAFLLQLGVGYSF